jgi:hypothetical protein
MTIESSIHAVCVRARWAVAGASMGFAALAGTPAMADSDLAGAWSGGGSVAFASGAKERASCRAKFMRAGASGYTMSALCATASAKVAQTASLRKVGANSYAGSFHNPEYGVTGSIHITVNGRSQSVSLSSDVGSASFRLSKL